METFDGAPAPDNGMPDAEVLARASAFDPTITECSQCHALPNWKGNPIHERIMRLALEMIAQQCGNVFEDPAMRLNRCGMAARQALRECE